MFGGGLNSEIEGWLGKNVKKHTNNVRHNRNVITKKDLKQKMYQTTMNKKKK